MNGTSEKQLSAFCVTKVNWYGTVTSRLLCKTVATEKEVLTVDLEIDTTRLA